MYVETYEPKVDLLVARCESWRMILFLFDKGRAVESQNRRNACSIWESALRNMCDMRVHKGSLYVLLFTSFT